MLIQKQKIIDAFGHFFVLCDKAEDGHIHRVHSNNIHTNIGNLDFGWEPRPPVSLEIVEVFGKPNSNKSYSVGLLDGIDNQDFGRNIFNTLEKAEARADAIRQDYVDVYERLREIGKTRELKFDTAMPEIPTVLNLQPEELDFIDPELFASERKWYGFYTNPNFCKIDILECEVWHGNELSPESYDPVAKKFKYDLKVSFWVPDATRGSRLSHEETIKGPNENGVWYFNTEKLGVGSMLNGRVFRTHFSFSTTFEGAKKAAATYAMTVTDNIRDLLPVPDWEFKSRREKPPLPQEP